jgi:hypothetical protein
MHRWFKRYQNLGRIREIPSGEQQAFAHLGFFCQKNGATHRVAPSLLFVHTLAVLEVPFRTARLFCHERFPDHSA